MIEYDTVKELVRIAEQVKTMEAQAPCRECGGNGCISTFLIMLATKLGWQDSHDWYEGTDENT